ncbi:hypothetical protein PG991_003292 [Apiospora marii]|uniref:NACHT domain-containing protein n=1 Tax=Apiospora marii TaxID=335849 RepID=A0ABR1SHZ1_9PEZI
MATTECHSRPRTTKALLERLENLGFRSSDGGPSDGTNDPDEQNPIPSGCPDSRRKKEAAALWALSQRMTRIFIASPQDQYGNIKEAAALAPFTKLEDFPGLFHGFVDAIARGSGDSVVPNIALLQSFNAVLHCPQALQCTQHEHLRTQLPLGHALLSLKDRLVTAGLAADKETQYRLLRTLGAILDAMNEVKFGGISDATVVEPLLKQLQPSCKDPELRVAQAARYASESLRGIPSDVSPWQKLGRSMLQTLGAAASVASSVATLDPTKLLDGLMGAPEAVEGLVKAVIGILNLLESSSGLHKDFDRAARARPASWQVALRYTDLFIRGRQPKVLELLLKSPKFSLSEDKHFLCGLCSQLEQAVNEGDSDNPTVPVLKEFLISRGRDSSSEHVQAWIQLTIPTAEIDNSSWRRRMKSKVSKTLGVRTFESNIGCSKVAADRLGDEGTLLEKAWETCPEAHLFYADQVVRDFYTNKDLRLLDVVRLDPTKCLPMAQCYINLSIVEGGNGQDGGKEARPSYALSSRMDMWEAGGARKVSLPELFQSKTPRASGSTVTKRVLIRGKAGVGKSTLCKRIVYDSIHHDLWSDVIDRVIWLPLRELKSRDTWGSDIRHFLRERFFKGVENGEWLAEALFQESEKSESTTLFLLDGLDEMQDGSSSLLRSLMGQQRVIITTRPHGVNSDLVRDIHQELETIGFSPDQVKQYVEAVSPEQADQVQRFIDDHPAIKGLISIPVQLDAFCYSFEADAFDISGVPRTMTELYRAIELAIWKKDVVQLDKKLGRGPTPTTAYDAHGSTPDEIWKPMQGEANALQALGFAGMAGKMEEFDTKYLVDFWDQKRNDFTNHLPPHQDPPIFGDLNKVSFLRTSSRGPATSGSYHFLHLTYQEYFAARFFVQHWPDKKLPGVKIRADVFLRREKYNPRYNIVWRFVAGLLHEAGLATGFFQMIESGPNDLLGLVHERLVMHCLAEVPLPSRGADLGGFRTAFEYRLQQWLSPTWLGKMEFPENVLIRGLHRPKRSFHRKFVQGLIAYRRKSVQIFGYCAAALEGDERVLSGINALMVLSKQPFPGSIVPQVISYLESISDSGALSKALNALKPSFYRTGHSGSFSSQSIFLKAVDFLDHPDRTVRDKAFDLLWGPSLGKDVLIKITNKLSNHISAAELSSDSHPQANPPSAVSVYHESDISHSPDTLMVKLLSGNKSADETILDVILDMLPVARPGLRHDLEKLVSERPTLPSSIVKRVFNMLQDSDTHVWKAAVDMLSRESVRSKMIPELFGLLKQPGIGNSDAAVSVLRQPGFMPREFLEELTDMLKSPQSSARDAAATILAGRESDFPVSVLQEMLSLLDDQDPGKRAAAMQALEKQKSLPTRALELATHLFRSRGDDSAMNILRNQLILPGDILDDLVDMLQSCKSEARKGITTILTRQKALPGKTAERLAALLDTADDDIKFEVSFILSKQPDLTTEALLKMAALVEDPSEPIRIHAREALTSQPSVSVDLLPKLVDLLKKP